MRAQWAILAAIATLSAFFVWLVSGGAGAQDVRQALPVPPWAHSVEVVNDGAIARLAPRPGAARRGTIAEGTRLTVTRRLSAEGCPTGTWDQVGDQAFVCDSDVRPSAARPGGVPQPPMPRGALLPFTYAFVRFDATRAYAHPSDYLTDEYTSALGEGFGLVLVDTTAFQGVSFMKTRRGLWIDTESLRPAGGSTFAGVDIAPGQPLDVAWVLRDDAPVRASPHGHVVRRASRRAIVHVAKVQAHGVVRLTDGTFMGDQDLARATTAPRPADVAPDARFIDVDVAEQVLVAWDGPRPVFATLVSTGKDAPGHRTPLGVFPIWAKLATSDMDDLERTDVSRNYSMQAVPWVQYFQQSNGLHAAFWHDDFGHRHSHGCVNLSPRDARRLFAFTRPALPPGWYALLPTREDHPTVVRVRDGDAASTD